MKKIEAYYDLLRHLRTAKPTRMMTCRLLFSNQNTALINSGDKCHIDFYYENLPCKSYYTIVAYSNEAGFSAVTVAVNEPLIVEDIASAHTTGLPLQYLSGGSDKEFLIIESGINYIEVAVTDDNTPPTVSINNSRPPEPAHIQVYAFTTEQEVMEIMGING